MPHGSKRRHQGDEKKIFVFEEFVLNQFKEITHDFPRLGDVKRNFADTSKARRMLGWMPTMGLEQGIEATIDYFMTSIETI